MKKFLKIGKNKNILKTDNTDIWNAIEYIIVGFIKTEAITTIEIIFRGAVSLLKKFRYGVLYAIRSTTTDSARPHNI